MTGPSSEEITQPWLLVCEGPSDVGFLNALIAAHHIDVPFDIFPMRTWNMENGRFGYGRGQLSTFLGTISYPESFTKLVRGVLILSDNDTPAAFEEITAHLQKAGFPIPSAPQVVARLPHQVPLVVYMLPADTNGNLEGLCLTAAFTKWNLTAALDNFVSATPAAQFPNGKQAKMKIQALLAATNEHQPDAGFGVHFTQPEQYRIPLVCQCFDPLVTFLRALPAIMQT